RYRNTHGSLATAALAPAQALAPGGGKRRAGMGASLRLCHSLKTPGMGRGQMSDIVSGFEQMVWWILGYDSTKEILRLEIPLNQADESTISEILRSLAAKHLTPAEIAAGLANVRRDDTGGNRFTLMAGQNPHYVAGLFRSDEIAKDR